jgi:hypothetical protein
MTMKTNVFGTIALALLFAVPATAQDRVAANVGSDTAADAAAAADSTEDEAEAAAASTFVLRPVGQNALNNFESPKFTGPFDGIKVTLGGAFTLAFQALDHSNTAAPNLVDGVDVNALGSIRPGINLPAANLNLGVQLAPGINLALESYMSSRHHNEFWVKGGYATIDQSPINLPALNKLMQYTTIRAGMYAPNYGDAIYRRSDNGYTINNPFAENYILDAFTTEPGADVMVRLGDAFVMGGVTSGQNKGDVKDGPIGANPAFLAKAGYDRQVTDVLRVRLSASAYANESSPAGTLFSGDRAGSAYWGVVDNAAAGSFTNGRLNPGFRNETTAFQINPFVKFHGLELFGVLERASGKAANETGARDVNQYAGDLIYRFLGDKLYVGGRYNVVKGDLSSTIQDITVDRQALAAGWFISPTMLTKVEYVQQSYDGFASTNILNGAEFSGFVIQGALAF